MKDSKINLFTLFLTLLAALLLASCTGEQAISSKNNENGSALQEAIEVTEASKGTILVPIDYKDERWLVGEKGVTVLPCEPPTPFYSGSEIQPLVQIVDTNGEVVYERNEALDPRFLLYEGPSDQPHILEEVSFTLRLPLLAGMQTLEYTVAPRDEEARKEQEPDLIVDLGPAVEQYEAAGAMEQEAPCQQPVYKPDQLDGEK